VGYPLREERPGAIYHVGTRGNNRRATYTDDATRVVFLEMLRRIGRRHDWRVLTYCLMGNHYHLVLELGDGGMSRGMQQLNGGYARWFNERTGRRDHLFGRRFWSREVVGDDDLVTTCSYIDANPVRSFGIAASSYAWSSYRAAIGLATPAGWHDATALWRVLAHEPRRAMDEYAALMEALLGPDMSGVRHRTAAPT
jgi:putative transposase